MQKKDLLVMAIIVIAATVLGAICSTLCCFPMRNFFCSGVRLRRTN